MYNRRYDKVFLMLRQETAGYAVGKRPPWGSCIMELKNGTGRLMLTVQGLRPLRYAVYLLAGQESIFCGELHPEKKEGHAELEWAFNPDAVGEGKCAEDFHTVLILAEEGGCSAPLAAYFGEKTDWKTILQPQKGAERQKKAEPQEMPKLQEKTALKTAETAALSEQKAEPPKTQEKPLSAQGCHGSFQGLLAKFRRELEKLEETGVLSAEETAHIRAAGKTENPPVREGGQCADTGAERVDKTTEIVDKVDTSGQQKDTLGQQKKLEPFGDGVLWDCLFLEELTLLAQIPLKWQKEFFFLLPYRRYHHLILRQAENGYRLGLPGEYSEAEEAEAQRFGFREFRRVDGDWGYWMAFLAQEG